MGLMEQDQAITSGNNDYVNRFDIIIERILYLLIIFMPFAFGARSAWSEEVVIVLSAAITITFLVKLLYYRQEPLVGTRAYLPLVIFIFIAVFQLVKLPADVISFISPDTAEMKSELLNDLPQAESVLSTISLSFYRNGTVHDLRLLLAAGAVFFVSVNVFRRADQIKRLLKVIAVTGGLVGLLAIAQDIFGNGKIYWFISAYGNARSGSFVNHNHFGQFMNLSIGAALGYVLVKLREDFAGKEVDLAKVMDYVVSPLAKPLWFFVIIMAIGAAAVFVSLTRGGMVSMVVAGSVICLLFVKQSHLRSRGWVMAVMALLAFTCILLVGFDAVYDRLATLRTLEGYEYRWQSIKDLSASFAKFPLFGTGLGTHAVVYPMFQNIPTTLLFTHVENEYIELIEEMGVLGFAALLFLGVIIIISFIKVIQSEKLPIHSAVYGLGFGLLAILIQSLSDYGQHVPANAFLSCIFCALIISLSKYNGATEPVRLSGRFLNTKTSRFFLLIAISAVMVWSAWGADRARIAEGYRKKVLDIEKGLIGKEWQGSESEYEDLISNAEYAAKNEPENIEYLYSLGVYRWYSISKAENIDSESEKFSQSSEQIISNIIDDLNHARIYCPTYGPTYSVLGQIEMFVLGDDDGAEKIKKGFSLASNDPIACFIAGKLDIMEGRFEESIPKFQKALQLKGGLFKEIVDIYIAYLSRPELAIEAAGEDLSRLNYVANSLDEMEYRDIAGEVRGKIKEVLEEKCLESNALAWMFADLASIYHKEGNIEEAIIYYRRALELDYSQISWRLKMAGLLAESGQAKEAMKEAKICLRVRPGYKAAQEFIEKLSVSKDFIREEISNQVY
jgi:O-antigen ligase/tetratricopeptide (TPR) repeat protein